ncbi:CAP domain-containing protein [Dyadobacter sp. CY356]|uniref:CAP domain-containing protein n=1 Tax=Dyadobacter sp. CY356 TaxID=2906442 RepID=UPI001F3E1CE7|nr:CAP domain-containing protein [Dyadobacter sp. CY356]MCF0056002.1 CAP domain-containing protein [Dyadobacter sp. CY356]
MRYFLIFGMFLDVYALLNSGKLGYYGMTDEDFFALPKLQQIIPLTAPDTLLLDAAIFQASNEARRKNGIPIFTYDFSLYLSSSNHARSMIVFNFYNHNNPYSNFERTASKRIELITNRFRRTGENIGQYQTLVTKQWFAVHWDNRERRYEFLDLDEKTICQPFTYADYAHYCVRQWMESAPHRANLLNTHYTYLGCAARLSAAPYQEKRAPYGRLVQNFGGEK